MGLPPSSILTIVLNGLHCSGCAVSSDKLAAVYAFFGSTHQVSSFSRDISRYFPQFPARLSGEAVEDAVSNLQDRKVAVFTKSL
jgi:hypothetical protein